MKGLGSGIKEFKDATKEEDEKKNRIKNNNNIILKWENQELQKSF